MMSWHFQITNNGVGALDSVQIVLTNADSIEFLSLIPQHTFSINSTCTNCVDTLITYQRTNYLCQNFVPDALRSATFRLLDFGDTDTVNVYFQTFRCASSDTLLFNIPKKMNSWGLRVLGKGICQDTAVHNLVGNPFFGFTQLGNISGHVTNGLNDVSLNTVFTPVVSDLTVPQDSVFGQSATFEVEFNGGISANDRQVLGCLTPNCTSLNGYLKATVYCEQGLVIRNPSSDVKIKMFHQPTNTFLQLNPVYYHTLTPADNCQQGEYSYYFELSNPVFKNVLDSGRFEFTLQSCCQQIEPTLYRVGFSILPDPDSCLSLTFPPGDTLEPICAGLGCEWIPLRKVENQIHVHCPGCVTPGMIVDNYVLRRTTFGLKDSNNDGIADSAAVFVNADTTYFNTHGIKTYHSTIGDELEDLLVSHFQQGDATNGGYEYSQMLPLGARLNFLQLRREIPAGLDTMQLTPVAFTFYVDSTDFSNPDCRDCEFFGVDTSRFRTMLQIHVDQTDTLFNTFLEFIPTENRLLFSFESTLDSLSNSAGNLHDYGSLIVHADTQLPFHGFYENQQYRLHVTYQQCSTLITSQLELNSQEDISTRSPIENVMWLSGVKQLHDAYPDQLQPTDTTALHVAGWTFDPLDPDTSRTLVDSSFTNEYVFYCSGYGRIHYFYFQNITFSARALNDTSCGKKLAFSTGIRTRASNIKAFPYEYRPTPLWHKQIEAMVPPGYYIAQARVQSEYFIPPVGYKTAWQYFNTNDTTGNILLSDSSWMLPVVFYEHLLPTLTDSNLYVMSERSNIYYELLLATDSCIMTPQVYPDSSIVYNFGLTPLPYAPPDSTFCQIDPPIVRSSLQSASHTLVLQPNLNGLFIPSQVEVADHLICFNLKVNNEPVPLDSPATVYSTGAPYVFLALPDSSSVPFLNNWFYVSAGDTIYPNDNIIPIDPWFSAGDSISANVCAFYNPCQDSIAISMWLGWDCEGFPSAAFDPDSVCGAAPVPVTIKDLGVAMNPGAKDHLNEYSLCQAVEISAPFTSQLNGGYLPQAISLSNLFTGLTPLYAFINQCNSPVTDTLQLQSPWLWNITGNNLASIGIADSTLHATECIRITIGLLPECAFVGKDTLPTMNLFGETFCGDTISFQAQFSGTFHWDSTSHCTDCFTIEKTALQDTMFVGDTATFQILICGNNSAAQQVLLTEVLPQDFTLISTIPSFINVPDQGCDTLLVSGYYSTPGTCNDSAYINTAQIITSQYDTLIDTACINVLDSCIAFSSLIVPDSAFSTTYGAGFSNTSVYISGVFFIDSTFILTNCTAYTSSSAQIIVLPGQQLILDSASIIMGCSSMWPGITLDTTAKIAMMNLSQLQDAHHGIHAGYNSTVDVDSSMIYDCVTGIYSPPAAGFVNTQVKVRGSKIGMVSPSFKQDYPGQPTHGVIPKAGIEINNIVMTLGGAGQRNEFFKMNTGIVANNSNLLVKNTEFYNIGYNTAYNEPYRGTAMVGIVNEGFTGKLTVVAEPTAYYAVHDCHRAIYTDRAVLSANYVHLIDVYSGIYGTNTPHQQTSHVTGCTITTQTYGIFWINNRSAKFMIANNNTITVNGSSNTAAKGFSKTAIYMSETMQQPVVFMATGNEITLNNAHNGIYSGNQANAKIKFNNIRMNTSSTGIGINNNNRSSVSCNSITGDYGMSSFQSIGILTGNSSDRTALHCNTTDSTYRGFYFGGANPNTVMKGNDMKYHNNGLYLTSLNTYIGTQPHHGNRWYGPFLSLAGVNLADPFWISSSRFDVDSTLGINYNPIVSPSSGWFFTTPDTTNITFYCDSSTVCDLPPPSLSQNEINELIASGTLLTEEYALETKAIATEYLYRELMEDSVLRYSDSLYIEFMLENQGEPVAYLYDAEEYLRATTAFDSVFSALIDSANVQMDAINDTLQMIDEGIEFYGSSYDYGALREQLIFTIEFLDQTIANLYSQAEASLNGNLAEAEIRNDLAVPETVPEENSSVLNDTEIEFLESGGNPEVILSRYSQLLNIAHQCPYTGGPAVERARAFIAMINDSMDYDDDAVCLQVGVYRNEPGTEIKNTSYSGKQVEIIPNPATNQFEIRLKSKHEGICNISVRNSKEQLIFADNFPCDLKSFNVYSGSWRPGIYFVSVTIDNSFTEIQKLVIVK